MNSVRTITLFVLIGLVVTQLVGVGGSISLAQSSLYTESFESYPADSDPADWLDTQANSSLTGDDSLFKVFDLGGQKVLGTTSTRANIHSHYVGSGSASWSGYRYTGRLMITHAYGGIGVTLFSDYPNTDAYYRLRRYKTNDFHISPHGTSITGGNTDTGVVPIPNTWYWFMVEAEDTGSQTEIRAKVWADGTSEPAGWQVQAIDASASRLTAGTVGLWGYNQGEKYWDNLTVEPITPPVYHNLTVNVDGGGSVARQPDEASYRDGQQVTLTAVADVGWVFSGWSGDLAGSDNPANVTMDADKSVTATFVAVPQYSLTVSNVGSGDVTLNPPGGVYDQGTLVELTAVADPGWAFSGWSGDLSGSSNPANVTMDAAKSVTATFVEVPQYSLTVSNLGSGDVTLNPPGGVYDQGTLVELTAVADPGWAFSGWSGDLSGSSNPASLTMDAAKNVTATFVEVPQHTLTVSNLGSGDVTLNPPGGVYDQGTLVELTAVADPGWAFSGWSGDLSGSSNPASLTLDADKSVTATFVEGTSSQYTEGFESYAAGADPADWLDTAANNSMVEDDGLFKVFDLGGQKVFGTTSTQSNFHSHYVGPDSGTWTGYRFGGVMMMTHPSGGIGVTVLSDYANRDAYYRLRRYGNNDFHISPHGTNISGGNTKTGVVPAPNTWYWFMVEVEDSGSQTEIRAKVWADGTSEPANWQVEAIDASASRLTVGTVGFWGYSLGDKYWDNLIVEPITPPVYRNLTVSNVGSGNVTLNPPAGVYDQGTVVELTAVADPGWAFSGWSGDLSGTDNPASVTMDADKSVTAAFVEVPQYSLTVSNLGSGDVTLNPPGGVYDQGTLVELTAVADPGWAFSGWSGDLTGSDNPASVTMDGNKTITANFVPSSSQPFMSDDFNACSLDADLWTFVDPVGDAKLTMNGTQALISVPAGVAHDIWTGGNFAPRIVQPTANTDFEIEAKFDSVVSLKYQLQGILIEEDDSNFLRLEVNSDGSTAKLFAASFIAGVPSIQANDPLAGGTPSYLRVKREGDLWTLSYSYDGVNWTTGVSFTRPMSVTQSGVYSGNAGGSPPAHTAQVDYVFNTALPIEPEDPNVIQTSLSVNTVGNGNVSKNPDQATYACGDVVTLTADGDPGWAFSEWSGGLTGSDNPADITMSGDKTVTATFVPVAQYTLTVNTDGPGSVIVDPPGGVYNEGTQVQLTAVPDPGSVFEGWSGGGLNNPVTLTMTADTTVTASFSSEVTYKEYWISHSEFTGGCGDHEKPDGGSWYLEPWPCSKTLEFEIPDDFSQALKVEIYLDLWRNHVGQSARFSLNGGPTHAPDVGYDWSRTPYIGEIPKSELRQGTNTITFGNAAGGYHVHDIAFRIYHDASHPLLPGPGSDVMPPDGQLTSIVASNGTFQPGDGGVLQVDNDQLTLNATASGASYVEFHGYYYGYDEDNDGEFLDWHSAKRNNRNPGSNGTIDHIGTDTGSPYRVTWDLAHIANQTGVKFKIRVVDGAGNVREAAGGVSADFSLARDYAVETYLNPAFRDGVLHHDGDYPDTGTWYVDLPADISDVTGAYLIGAFWNNPRISVNGQTSFPAFATGQDTWALSIRAVPAGHLQPGQNAIEYSHTSGFGEFIEEPGPMIVLRRSSPPSTYTLNVSTSGGGSVDVEPDQATYSPGQEVTLTATPDTDWSFGSWSGDLTGSDNPATLVMTGDKAVTAIFNADTQPFIDVWYGSSQPFGQIGVPQPWVNIVGNVSDDDGVGSLAYSLNGGPSVPLSIGPDGRRLARTGDFTADVAVADLQSGTNTILFTATDRNGNTNTRTVMLDYQPGNTWPLPYSIDWSSLPSDGNSQTPDVAIQTVAHVVDGKWTLEGDTVRTVEPGYDRMIGIGDELWKDIEATVSLTPHSMYGDFGFGFLFRWNGHTDSPVVCGQPKCGWEPLGSLSWIRSGRVEFYGTGVSKSISVRAGTTYWLKVRVETNPSGSLYSLKVWEDGQNEPTDWTITRQEGSSNPPRGSLLLITHKADVSFGDVVVTSLGPLPPASLTVTTQGSGGVTVDPDQSEYPIGTPVTLTANPDPGWVFTRWSGSLTGNENPGLLTISGDATVTAHFTPAGSRVTDSQVALYTFKEGSGPTVFDASGFGTPLDLTINKPGNVSWLPGGGLVINSPVLVASPGTASKLINAARASNELTIEAWLKPANSTQDGPARIVSLSNNLNNRNFTLGQGLWGSNPSNLYDVRMRTTTTSNNGQPSLTTPPGSLTTTLTHLVYTRAASGTARIYIDGVERSSGAVGGDLGNWDSGYRLGLANELTGDRPWLGELHLVAIFDRALSQAEVEQNFAAGPN